jgi:hypothetical protein
VNERDCDALDGGDENEKKHHVDDWEGGRNEERKKGRKEEMKKGRKEERKKGRKEERKKEERKEGIGNGRRKATCVRNREIIPTGNWYQLDWYQLVIGSIW